MKDKPDQGNLKQPIAVVGIGCSFPGGVSTPETFWRLLHDGIDAVTEIPTGRFDADTYYDSRPATPGKIMSRWGGFLEQIDRFDASFFGISPREADRLDPQQRLLLETTWKALEDAGQVVDKLTGSQTGVFVGLWLNDYEARLFADPAQVDFYMTTGSGRYSASGRISYTFGFQGPSITIDCACSSSLVAVHLACQSLWSGECSLALAGGANVILQPHITIAYSQSKMMAPDGRCKFGDARADGYVRSEGAGMVVLKPLACALADGDPIYAVIRGSAVNNDGRSSGYLATPAQLGQEALLRQAYRDAGVSPGEVQYVEAHGTGTRAGDPVEIGALGAVLATGRTSGQSCLVGSVKTNFGHTEGAAGIAGLIKVALALQHRAIPASLHVQELNSDIPWQELPVAIPRQMIPWPDYGETRIGGVSSFGIAGTNAHVVLAAAPDSATSAEPILPRESAFVLPLSAHTPEALRATVENYLGFLSQENTPVLQDIAYTASCRRTHHEHRLAAVGHNREELAQQLQAFLEGESPPGIVSGYSAEQAHKVVFVFPGQGSQWLGMGRELMAREPVFRQVLEECDVAIRLFTDWSLLQQLATAKDECDYCLDQIDVIQPTLLSIEIALAKLWRSWGVEPDAVIGHSMGEVGAAYIAGALSLEDAMRIICRRSQLLRRTSGRGAMAMVELTIEEAQAALAGYEDRLSIAVSNSPRATVLSGDPAALNEVIAALQARDVFCRLIKVDVASHSPQMDPLKPDLLAALAGLQPRAAAVPIYSTAVSLVTDGSHFDADYWVQNLRQPVRFSQMTQQLLADGYDVFIEMSPHPILLPAVQQGFQHANQEGITLASMRRGDSEQASMLNSLAALYTAGYPVNWARLYPSGHCVSLPPYSWQRERFWYEAPAFAPDPLPARPGAHPLLQRYLSSATGSHIWETELGLSSFSYLQDHRVGGTIALPAAAIVEMVLAAAREVYEEAHALENVTFSEALVVPTEGTQTVQLVLTNGMLGTATFQLYGRIHETEQDEAPAWTRYASGSIRLTVKDKPEPPPNVAMAGTVVDGATHYQAMAARGLPYGPAFQAVRQLRRQKDSVVADLQLPEVVTAEAARYHLHPSLLDAGFQLLLATLGDASPQSDTYLPIGVERIWVDGHFPSPTKWQGRASQRVAGDELVGDVFLHGEMGQVIAAAYGLRLQRLSPDVTTANNYLYEVKWQLQPLSQPAPAAPAAGSRWLILTDKTGVGDGLAAQLKRAGAAAITVAAGTAYQEVGPEHYTLNPAEPEQFRQLLQAIAAVEQPLQGIIHLWSLNGDPESTDLNTAQEQGVISILHLVQAIIVSSQVPDSVAWPRLWLATRGVQPLAAEPVNVAQSPVWGLSRVIANEHPELNCTCVDLNVQQAADTLLAEVVASDPENEVAYRNGSRYVARLVRYQAEAANNARAEPKAVAVQDGQGYRLEMATPGILDHLYLQTAERRQPEPGEVEIEIVATGLNFIDVMKAMSIYPGLNPDEPVALGAECAGRVTAVGAGVEAIGVGDEVMAITPAFEKTGFFSAYVTIPAAMVLPKPANLSFEEATTLPIAFLTAYYALQYLGRMSQGEVVLIHSASGGVGLAAIQLAQKAGAKIFATAGSPEKRAYLRDLGVEHVMDSRSLDFARELMALTDGRGVDLVLNSLTGEALRQSFAVLAPYGRFLEIGKRDIYQNGSLGLAPFKNNLAFFAIDLARTVSERPSLMMSLLGELIPHFETGKLRPLPIQRFPVADIGDAFRTMAQAKHIGKIVVAHQRENLQVLEHGTQVRANATYLLTGGLGGLGLTVARWLVAKGARHLVLAGRRGPSVEAQAVIDDLEAQGAQIVVVAVDVADKKAVAAILAQITETMPPLRGVLHAAGILDDSTLLQMDRARFLRAMAPKVNGAWHLHNLTQDAILDFFLLFSSVTSLLGTPGQSNYAAANAFLDALAHHRRAQGQPALSINWGPWSEVGLAAAQANRGQRLAQRGLGSLTPAQGIAALEKLLPVQAAQVAVMPFNLPKWCQFYPTAQGSTLFNELQEAGVTGGSKSETGDVRQRLLAAELGRPRRTLFESHLQEQVAHVLRQAPARIPLNKPLKTLGLDSLMTLELRNRLEASLGLKLPATFIFNYPTIMALGPHLADKMGISLEMADPRSGLPPNNLDGSSTSAELDALSSGDVEDLLAAELDSIENLLKGS